jgi:hypothetical protein
MYYCPKFVSIHSFFSLLFIFTQYRALFAGTLEEISPDFLGDISSEFSNTRTLVV